MSPARCLTPKELGILRLLAENGESYGLDLVRRSSGRVKRGTVYVYLHRLEKDGLVTSTLKEASGSRGPQRRVYECTAKGHAVIHAHETMKRALEHLEHDGAELA